ncbi:MAG: von Willebrand factor [Candidatus Peribacteria bacterium]|nr:von Willebrand factor [Candidatus Peribacteria bacterium]
MLSLFLIGSLTVHAATQTTPPASVSPLAHHVAMRLQTRLVQRGVSALTIPALEQLVIMRQALLRSSVQISFTAADGTVFPPMNVFLQAHPEWIIFSASKTAASFMLDANAAHQFLISTDVPGIAPAVHSTVVGIQSENGVERMDMTGGLAKSGWIIDRTLMASEAVRLLTSGGGLLSLPVTYEAGTVDTPYGSLELLATGHSDFSTSIKARASNVRKAIGNVHSVAIAPGETFSFNHVLDFPIATSRGWMMAKTIFEGWQLRDAPGGGICQASTTTFRAAVNAGLPILERKSHSLYVHYYEMYGVGLDSTVFPFTQDFKFVNDTGNYLVLQTEVSGFDAYVRIFGKPDGRTVKLNGPYFYTNAPAGMRVNGRLLRANEIAWVRSITYVDGTTKNEQLVSVYKSVPKSVVKKYTTEEVAVK